MPTRPKRPCSYPGCPNLTDGQYCEQHRKEARQKYDKYERSPEVNKTYGRAWKRIRDRYVHKHPLCEQCLKEGKSYSVTERMCKLTKKYGDNVKCYWMRISETSTKQLLLNKADKLVDPDLKRKYDLELTTKGGNVYNRGKKFCEVYPLCSFGKLKGVGFFDKDFTGKYFIVLDEFQLEQGEKRTSFDILYNFIGMIENIARTTKNNIEVWLLGNTLEEASTILKAFNFLPEKFGRFYLKRKRCIIDNLEPSEAYIKDRKGSIADILGGGKMSNYTNMLVKDKSLLDRKSVV